MKVGIFDSGTGGMSVLHEAYHLLGDDVSYIFYADLDHVPYGLKTTDQIIKYSKDIAEFLIKKGVDAIVVACNTATAAAIEVLRHDYDLPILGMEPAVKPAVEETELRKRILVMATPVTIREDKLAHLLERVDDYHRVDLLPMPNLVTFAENGEFDSENVESYILERLDNLNISDYQALVLGCTHFNYFKPSFRKIFGSCTLIIDGNAGTIRHLADICGLKLNDKPDKKVEFSDLSNMLKYGKTEYYISGRPINDEIYYNKLLTLHNRLEAIREL
ncbi:glutamate racemase [Butyrivibrio sp. NC3005]|uniref:glutamate racemase n=1 Tax=Butyrivibrio sp. NC3005 TaxID=1280685 RepID=UPI0004040674|nr:glutamate racemase [Butyrivibrio sp. NC3005]